jgi:peroxiredoxin
MKRILLALIISPVVLFAQQSPKGFTISAKVTGLPENSLVSVSDVNNPKDTAAKATVKNGSFLLKGSVQEPNLYYLNFAGAQKRAVVFLGNDQLTVSGDATDLQKLSIKGSSSHDDFMQFQETFNPKFQMLSGMAQQINSGSNDSLMNAYNQLLADIRDNIGSFIEQKKSSPVSPFLLLVTNEVMADPELVQTRLSSLDPMVQKGFYGKLLQNELDKRKIGSIGSQAIEFTQNDTTGNPVSLSSFKGKYVLIDFWASWCRPCRMENPNVVKAFNKFRDKNFTVLGISLDRSKEAWLQAIKDDNLAWTQLSDLKFWSNEVAIKYGIESIPQNFLVDPEGKIIGKNLRGEALEDKLCELLGCN